jgi:acetate kinase
VRVLVVNAGSSSLKLTVLAEDGSRVAATEVERWEGEGHLEPLRAFLDALDGRGGIGAVGHRVVHGGPRLTGAVLVDDEVTSYLDSVADLAPLHNPRAVAGIREVAKLLPELPAVACFDTAFHAGMPAAARTYALPREWNERWSLRRYGFHGLSHASAVRRAAAVVGRPAEDLRLVSCHLGAGASLAAVREGRSVDTTMGFTPLAGLVMQTRSGSVDPGLVMWLLQHGGLDVDTLEDALEHRSGLKGLSGTSGDLRDVEAGMDAGDERCRLAYDTFVHRLRREVAAMAASAGGLDVLVLTGGIGEHSPRVRASLADGLGWLGVVLDPEANATPADEDREIGAAGGPVRTVVVAASEETEIARQTRELLQASR